MLLRIRDDAPSAALVTLALCVTCALGAAGCATSSGTAHLVDLNTDQASSHDQVDQPLDTISTIAAFDRTEGSPSWPSHAGDGQLNLASSIEMATIRSCAMQVAAGQTASETGMCRIWQFNPTAAIQLRDDVSLRPPLRRLWFHHPRLIPLKGEESQIRTPRGETAYEDRGSQLTFRNPYTGLRDQPLLHRETSDSSDPGIGAPPPKHTIKTFGTLTALSLIGIGVYAWAPTSFTGADKENEWVEARDHFREAWTKPPVVDKDRAAVNFLGHPYFGMNFYLTQRNYGESPLYSFLFSTLTSTCFEYFIESWAERPSVQDLLITPIVGSILGELVYQATQAMRKDGFTQAEKIMVTIINPLYVLQNGYH